MKQAERVTHIRYWQEKKFTSSHRPFTGYSRVSHSVARFCVNAGTGGLHRVINSTTCLTRRPAVSDNQHFKKWFGFSY
jgi:hypothetical protein